MFEETSLISAYLGHLRKELIVQGLPAKKVEEVLSETDSHLEEMLEGAGVEEAPLLLRQFGNAKALAKSIAAEHERSSLSRWYLWPAGFTFGACLLLKSPVIDTFYRAFAQLPWSGIYFIICAIVLGILGFKARKPLFGQFVLVGAGIFIVWTLWAAATSYPVATFRGKSEASPEWYEPISRGHTAEFESRLNMDISREQEIIRRVKLGKAVFSSANVGQAVPVELAFRGQYLLPEAVYELNLDAKPASINRTLLTSSWDEAAKSWNGVGSAQRYTQADWILESTPYNIANDQRSIDYLKWVQAQPFTTQLALDAQMPARRALAFATAALIPTNLGWLLWMFTRAVGRRNRRVKYLEMSV